ncbi:cellular retinoic acid-binding protein 2 isoform X2 [Herpailurus yagouaroundi]|uniref:cellular retinoic acid-binding protein 2 isoform X2 n=1 Tax=Herpailurus yagouaroundi TaxID=1608482 RepID=UPI001AD635D8|nr:cellular retinoic acid-binding protein 2 isoform X2 [Puma yagouaroundi]
MWGFSSRGAWSGAWVRRAAGSGATCALSPREAGRSPGRPPGPSASGALPLAASGTSIWVRPPQPAPQGSPRVAGPAPSFDVPLRSCWGGGGAARPLLPPFGLRTTVTPETPLHPLPGAPSLPPTWVAAWRAGAPRLGPRLPSPPPAAIPWGSGEPGDGETALIKSSCQVIGCDLCPPQTRARGSCLTLRCPPNPSRAPGLPRRSLSSGRPPRTQLGPSGAEPRRLVFRSSGSERDSPAGSATGCRAPRGRAHRVRGGPGAGYKSCPRGSPSQLRGCPGTCPGSRVSRPGEVGDISLDEKTRRPVLRPKHHAQLLRQLEDHPIGKLRGFAQSAGWKVYPVLRALSPAHVTRAVGAPLYA